MINLLKITKDFLTSLRAGQQKNLYIYHNFKRRRFSNALALIVAKIFAQNNDFSKSKFDKIADIFIFSKPEKDAMEEIIKMNISSDVSIKAQSKVIAEVLTKRDNRIFLLESLVEFCAVTIFISQQKYDMLSVIAENLNLDHEDFTRATAKYKILKHVPQKTDYYKILGVEKSASPEEIKLSYKKLMKQFHPDIISSRNVTDEVVEEARAKIAEINNAYEALIKPSRNRKPAKAGAL